MAERAVRPPSCALPHHQPEPRCHDHRARCQTGWPSGWSPDRDRGARWGRVPPSGVSGCFPQRAPRAMRRRGGRAGCGLSLPCREVTHDAMITVAPGGEAGPPSWPSAARPRRRRRPQMARTPGEPGVLSESLSQASPAPRPAIAGRTEPRRAKPCLALPRCGGEPPPVNTSYYPGCPGPPALEGAPIGTGHQKRGVLDFGGGVG